MVSPKLKTIAAELNSRAHAHPIGRLQKIRSELKGSSRKPGQDIFRSNTIHDDYAFHFGGRSELQFNIAIEDVAKVTELRHGVAFSLETSRSLPSIGDLIPKIRLFNEFMRLNPKLFADMRMWHYNKERSKDYMPIPVAPELVHEGVFIFLGKRQPMNNIDYEEVLLDFDRLLPLYQYVQSAGRSEIISAKKVPGFTFRSGCSAKASKTSATKVQKQLNITLRHNELQDALHNQLASKYGAKNVGTENPSGAGTSIDVVVQRPSGYWFYEIKTYQFPRACIREAVGQLLEYAFWPGTEEAIRLVVVGETALDSDGKKYLSLLKKRFSIPIDYEQIIA